MAELGGGGGGGKKKGGKVRAKKSSTRIDMTPMVDLAFLLLTFFVMTTTLNKPQTMEITMPEKPKPGDEMPEINEKNVLTLVLGEDDKVYWYMGITNPEVKVSNFSATGIRKVLLAKKAELPKLVVLIKAMDESKYKNMVDIMDEMNISAMQRFALVDITDTDVQMVKESQL
ncbi:MAG: biopolymer transporter ExbD [Cyclobacteriaceae bacterium]